MYAGKALYSCNMGMKALSDMYVRLPEAEGIHIRQSLDALCYS